MQTEIEITGNRKKNFTENQKKKQKFFVKLIRILKPLFYFVNVKSAGAYIDPTRSSV